METVLTAGRRMAPGLALAGTVAAGAFGARHALGVAALSPMILAIVLGVGVRAAAGMPNRLRPGVGLAARTLLRLAVVLLGAQVTLAQVGAIGGGGVLVLAAALGGTFLFTLWLGRALGVGQGVGMLIAAGTSICGASAVAAVRSVTRADDADVAYAVACVTLFGTLAMVLLPLAAAVLGLDPAAYGLWVGASVHEVAQVVAAAYQRGVEAGEIGTVAKLARVVMLAPVVMALGLWLARGGGGMAGEEGAARPPFPWFVAGFAALVLVNSLFPLPASVTAAAGAASVALLTVALGALGLETDLRALKAKGLRPLVLAAAAWLFIAGFSLVLVRAVV
ncbi:putative integral membrane protein (TIGR00698 family) [Azospirillum fermentarium]|uniref:YeiH family protein n=1 Tax=Azospirillum fermentarium TaxID=1233114 RepID=UPI0022262364|nr:putative sulfate exporter family transporter [Azospirillum fermentarium]MCW2247084.1 putative integral membrane protein (TIGR00698 family) [Azospirillum fermentarium]